MKTDRVAIVSTVKAPMDVLQPWIRHHLDIGIERFYLFLDDPADEASAELEATDRVHVVRCTPAYWSRLNGTRPDPVPGRQAVNVNHGMSLAAASGCNWVAHIDCDELIRPLMPLEDILASTGADGLRMTVLEAVSEQLDYPGIFDPSLFKTVPTRGQALAAVLLGCFGAFRYGEYFRGHTASKMLIRLDGTVTRMGIHKPVEFTADYRFKETKALQLLHFDGIGFDDWDKKWTARIKNEHSAFGFRPARVRQLEAYRKAARKGRDSRVALFRKTQMIPRREAAVLKRLGLLHRIESHAEQSGR